MSRGAGRGALAAFLVLATAAAACSSDGDGDASPGTSGGGATEATIAAADVPGLPPASAPGTGTIVVGGTSSSFAVSACRLEPDPSEPEGARALVAVDGAGTTASGIAFTVELQRFATGTGDVVTYTDTVSYSDSGRILQAQRIEVRGQVTDLRDPDATSSLIRLRADGVTAAGLAGPPGAGADDEGIVGLALTATCS